MNIPNSFSIEIFEQSKMTDTLSKARAGIFYRGENRNGTYISDSFAETLLSTLPYTPIKGIYDEEEEDFTTHGERRDLGRIYGIIPSKDEMNFAWEEKEDKDGVVRTYAVADAYLFTALYEEAEEIVGKPLSMEIYPPSIRGDWETIGDKQLFRYTDGSFLGVQVLGDDVEPCFEGASFFSLDSQKWYTMFMSLSSKVDELITGRQEVMSKEYLFELSSNQKDDAIFQEINSDGKIRYYVQDKYESYAIVYDFETGKFLKVNFTVDESDKLSVDTNFEELFAEYVTDEEKDALKRIRGEKTYKEALESYQANENKIIELESQVNESLEKISTLEVERENFEKQIEELTGERDTLNSYKVESENAKKQEIFEKYSTRISEDIANSIKVKLAEYTVESLEKDLAYELVQQNEDLFNLKAPAAIPKSNEEEPSGLESLLIKHTSK